MINTAQYPVESLTSMTMWMMPYAFLPMVSHFSTGGSNEPRNAAVFQQRQMKTVSKYTLM